MNTVERFVYNLVRSNPKLKMKVRDAYQGVCDIVPVRRNYSKYPIVAREGYFFGFHDKTPWNAKDTLILAHRALIGLRMPTPEDELEVGYFADEPDSTFVPLARTKAWNWHQGAQLQWVGQQDIAAFNDFDGKRHITRMVDTHGQPVATLSLPIAAISPDGMHALSYDFARLRGSPHGYAYANGVDAEADSLVPTKSGLSIIDLKTGVDTKLFTLSQLANTFPDPTMDGCFHYISHCQFSRDGKRFKFFHRWTKDENRQWTRMFSADLNGENLHLFDTDGMVSHVGWRTANSVVAYARTRKEGDGYYEFQDLSDSYQPIGADAYSSDGHPSFGPNPRWMVTDTYPDRFRRRFLSVYDMQEKKKHDLAMLFSPKQFAGVSIADHLQVDFHPRWNRAGTKICFDSAHTGERALCVLDLGDPQEL